MTKKYFFLLHDTTPPIEIGLLCKWNCHTNYTPKGLFLGVPKDSSIHCQMYLLCFLSFFFLFFFGCKAYGILVPQTGIEATHSALKVWHLSQWTTREVPSVSALDIPLSSQLHLTPVVVHLNYPISLFFSLSAVRSRQLF